MPYYTDKEVTTGIFALISYVLLAGIILPVVIFRWCKSQFGRATKHDSEGGSK